MAGNEGGPRLVGYMGLAVVVAVNLAMFRGVMGLLTIPAVAVFVVLLDVALVRLLFSRRALRPHEYAFIATGFALTMLTLPINNDPGLLQAALDAYRRATGDARIFRFNSSESFIYAERATLAALILLAALGAGALTGWIARRLGRRRDRAAGTS